MGDTDASVTRSADELADREPVDSLVVATRPPAIALDGERVSCAELESAAELSRMARRLGLDRRGVNGFRLYAAYVRYRDLRRRAARVVDLGRWRAGRRR